MALAAAFLGLPMVAGCAKRFGGRQLPMSADVRMARLAPQLLPDGVFAVGKLESKHGRADLLDPGVAR
jgi:hypothetical protein